MDVQQADYNAFTGNRQGLYVKGSPADFDLYIYRDAYSAISAECPANQYGTSRTYTRQGYVLDNIHVNDWAMYAGVEFGGNEEYDKIPDSLKISASSATTGGNVEVWLDSLETGDKIAECPVGNTGGWTTFQTFTAAVKPVSGRHDVYLKFTGSEAGKLFQLLKFYFSAEGDTIDTAIKPADSAIPQNFGMEQNFPNPFNPSTTIKFQIPNSNYVTLRVYNQLGQQVASLLNENLIAGRHEVDWNAAGLASGIYLYRLQAGSYSETKKLVLLR